MAMSENELWLLRQDRLNLAFFLRAEIGPDIIRLYAGAGDFPMAPNVLDPSGATYSCVGRWGEGMPDVDHLINGEAQALSLTLSGVDRETAKNYLLDRSLVVGAPASLGWCVLDDRYRPAGPVRWPVRGHLSQPQIIRQRKSATVMQRSVSVVLLAGAASRRRPKFSLLVGADQRRRSPTDAACDGVGQLTPESTRKWPN
ncbi:hypothetical protein [Brevundimonas nasdae]|uniref:hypothetical protein n=1 Tax=Brevundimonas nasdae TaxID=172043 RepID=UPI003F68F992